MKRQATTAATVFLFAAIPAMAQPANPPTPAWITASNQPCKIWNPSPQPNESVTWSGPCKDGFASGEGVLRWTEDGKPDVEYRGGYANGRRNGHGIMIMPDGKRIEGQWLNDTFLVGDHSTI